LPPGQVVHVPAEQVSAVNEQSVRAPVNPEPEALQMVATLPSQAGWFGVQTRGVQMPASQYSVLAHAVTVKTSPSALQASTLFP